MHSLPYNLPPHHQPTRCFLTMKPCWGFLNVLTHNSSFPVLVPLESQNLWGLAAQRVKLGPGASSVANSVCLAWTRPWVCCQYHIIRMWWLVPLMPVLGNKSRRLRSPRSSSAKESLGPGMRETSSPEKGNKQQTTVWLWWVRVRWVWGFSLDGRHAQGSGLKWVSVGSHERCRTEIKTKFQALAIYVWGEEGKMGRTVSLVRWPRSASPSGEELQVRK